MPNAITIGDVNQKNLSKLSTMGKLKVYVMSGNLKTQKLI